jgi:YidC/Oxa1 family membrane protein insertase
MMSASADPNQRRMMMALPLFFVIVLYRYPAGLLVYWITTNLWTIGQGYFVRRSMGSPPPVASSSPAPAATSSSNGSSKGSAKASAEPALAGAGTGSAPPPSPRKKKKRSGRRR